MANKLVHPTLLKSLSEGPLSHLVTCSLANDALLYNSRVQCILNSGALRKLPLSVRVADGSRWCIEESSTSLGLRWSGRRAMDKAKYCLSDVKTYVTNHDVGGTYELNVEHLRSVTDLMHGVAFAVYRIHSFQAIFFVLLSCVCSAQARRNVTVDSNDPLIRYTPTSSWRKIVDVLDAGGEHMLTQDPNAFALINFTFVSYWIMSARWPYRVRTQHTVDGNTTFVIDLQDHNVPDVMFGRGNRVSTIVARYIGASESRHTIRISIPPRERFAVVDRLIFEVEENQVEESHSSVSSLRSTSSTPILVSTQTSSRVRPTSTATPTTIASSPTVSTSGITANSSAADKERMLTIILGVVGPFLVLACVILLAYLYSRRRTKTKQLGEDTSRPPKGRMVNAAANRPIRVLRPTDPNNFSTPNATHTPVIRPYLPYTPLHRLGESSNPPVTHTGAPSQAVPFRRMARTPPSRPHP